MAAELFRCMVKLRQISPIKLIASYRLRIKMNIICDYSVKHCLSVLLHLLLSWIGTKQPHCKKFQDLTTYVAGNVNYYFFSFSFTLLKGQFIPEIMQTSA